MQVGMTRGPRTDMSQAGTLPKELSRQLIIYHSELATMDAGQWRMPATIQILAMIQAKTR
jgi:hypothetical protein